MKVTGGGAAPVGTNFSVAIAESFPSDAGTAWTGTLVDNGSASVIFTVYAICSS